MPATTPLTPEAFSKLRWRCRRGLLENDLIIARYFEHHSATMTEADAQAMYTLMDLTDNDLLDLLLGRKQPAPDWATPQMQRLLHHLCQPMAQPLNKPLTGQVLPPLPQAGEGGGEGISASSATALPPSP